MNSCLNCSGVGSGRGEIGTNNTLTISGWTDKEMK